MSDEQHAGPQGPRSFPGGRAKLPLINPRLRPPEPEMAIVGTAFVRHAEPPAPPEDAAPTTGGFSGYFTYESLFEEPEPTPTEEVMRGEDPYRVLRLKHDCTWDEVAAAHRHLAKEFHPDRFVGQEPEIIEQAENEIRRINLAFDKLKTIHPDAP